MFNDFISANVSGILLMVFDNYLIVNNSSIEIDAQRARKKWAINPGCNKKHNLLHLFRRENTHGSQK